jgi:hypothetical protein
LAFADWLAGPDTSLAFVPLSGDRVILTKLRKALRDIRDRATREDRRWKSVAMAGLCDGNRALILIHHPGIDRDEVWDILERRWPEIILTDPGNIEPTTRITVNQAADLARRKRGIEPLRIILAPRRAASTAWDEPMPMVF